MNGPEDDFLDHLKEGDILDDLDLEAEEELLRFSDNEDSNLIGNSIAQEGVEYVDEEGNPVQLAAGEKVEVVRRVTRRQPDARDEEDVLQVELDPDMDLLALDNKENAPGEAEVSSSGLAVSGEEEEQTEERTSSAVTPLDAEEEEDEDKGERGRDRFRNERQNIITLTKPRKRAYIPDTLESVVVEEEATKACAFLSREHKNQRQPYNRRGSFQSRGGRPRQQPNFRNQGPLLQHHNPMQQIAPQKHGPWEGGPPPGPPPFAGPPPPPHPHYQPNIPSDGCPVPRKILINPHFKGAPHGVLPHPPPSHTGAWHEDGFLPPPPQSQGAWPPPHGPPPSEQSLYDAPPPNHHQHPPPFRHYQEPQRHYQQGPPPHGSPLLGPPDGHPGPPPLPPPAYQGGREPPYHYQSGNGAWPTPPQGPPPGPPPHHYPPPRNFPPNDGFPSEPFPPAYGPGPAYPPPHHSNHHHHQQQHPPAPLGPPPPQNPYMEPPPQDQGYPPHTHFSNQPPPNLHYQQQYDQPPQIADRGPPQYNDYRKQPFHASPIRKGNFSQQHQSQTSSPQSQKRKLNQRQDQWPGNKRKAGGPWQHGKQNLEVRKPPKIVQTGNIREIPIVDNLTVVQPKAEEEDEATRELRQKIEEQAKLRQAIMRRKEERRRQMASLRLQDMQARKLMGDNTGIDGSQDELNEQAIMPIPIAPQQQQQQQLIGQRKLTVKQRLGQDGPKTVVVVRKQQGPQLNRPNVNSALKTIIPKELTPQGQPIQALQNSGPRLSSPQNAVRSPGLLRMPGQGRGQAPQNLRGPSPQLRGSNPHLRGSSPQMRGPGPQIRGPPPQIRGQAPQIRGPGPQIRGPGPQVRSPGPQVRGPGPQIRGPGPQIRGPGPQIRGPGPQIRSPGPRGPGPHVRGPGPQIRGPGPQIRSPGPQVRGPGPQIRGPGPQVRGPGPQIRGPGPQVRGPGTQVRGPAPPTGAQTSIQNSAGSQVRGPIPQAQGTSPQNRAQIFIIQPPSPQFRGPRPQMGRGSAPGLRGQQNQPRNPGVQMRSPSPRAFVGQQPRFPGTPPVTNRGPAPMRAGAPGVIRMGVPPGRMVGQANPDGEVAGNQRTVLAAGRRVIQVVNRAPSVQTGNATGNGQQQIPQQQQRMVKMPQSTSVVITNLAVSTTDAQLGKLCRAVGPVENIKILKQECKAIVKFKQALHAVQFQKKYQRFMLDLSMIQVALLQS